MFKESEESQIENLSRKQNSSLNPIVQKFTKMIKELDTKDLEMSDQVYVTNFGSIRFDSDNLPIADHNDIKEESVSSTLEPQSMETIDKVNDSSHSELPVFSNIETEKSLNDLGFIDDQYIAYVNTDSDKKSTYTSESFQRTCSTSIEEETADLTLIDDQYFNLSERPQSLEEIRQRNLGSTKISHTSIQIEKEIDTFHFDDALIDENLSIGNNTSTINSGATKEELLHQESQKKYKPEPASFQNYTLDESSNIAFIKPLTASQIDSQEINENVNKTAIIKETMSKPLIAKKDIPKDDSEFQSAVDYVKEERKKKQEDSPVQSLKRYKKIIACVPKFSSFLKYDMVKLLKKNILYNNYDVIGLNKPYGIPIHGGGGEGIQYIKHHFKLVDLLPELAESLKIKKIYPIHRLDLNTTGVILFATSESMAEKLKSLFKKGRIQKSYLGICKGIPKVSKGIINIPISEGSINGSRRMVLRPDVDGFRSKNGRSRSAITKYNVLSSTNSCSLMELKPATGIKHQLRVHLGFGLGCPILGDHKYSHVQKLVPQKLSSDMLLHLEIEQSRVRDLPMFLHARNYSIPDIMPYKNVSISAPLPKHFRTVLKFLDLTKSRSQEQKVLDELIYDEPNYEDR